MKIISRTLFAAFLACVSVGGAFAQGTAFTYQGQLSGASGPVNGLYDFQFGVFDSTSGGAQIGGTLVTNGVGVTNGLFTITLDFGANVFTGNSRWLDLAAHTNQSPNAFTSMTPRQALAPAPYAVLAGGLNPSAQINIAGLTVQQNADGAPNIIEGASLNFVSNNVVGATIGGGGSVNYFGHLFTNSVAGDFGTVAGGASNTVSSYAGTIGGGQNNLAGGEWSTVAGGLQNTASGVSAPTVGGGANNTASANYATVGGGAQNNATNLAATVAGGIENLAGAYSTAAGGFNNHALGGLFYGSASIGGGQHNTASGDFATIPGGFNNLASGSNSLAAGNYAQATNSGAFVWADTQNTPFTSTNDDSFNVRARGGVRFVTAGAGMTLDGAPVLTSGAGSGIVVQQNSAGAPNLIEGSSLNFVSSGVVGATISGGGAVNYNGSSFSNSVTGDFGTVSGGYANRAISPGDFVGGGGLDDPAGNIAQGGNSVVVGGSANVAGGYASFIGGGYGNGASGNGAVVGGGGSNIQGNHAAGNASVVVGGELNTAGGSGAFVGGGGYDGNFFTASGNFASGGAAVIVGGLGNSASGNESAVGGGVNNRATNYSATVPGGRNNLAGGQYSFAAGQQAQATNDGAFVWADSQNATFSSSANDQFLVRAQGGVGINMNNPAGASLYVKGNRSGGWLNSVSWFENTNISTSVAPALRVVSDGGTNLDGALSVSSNGKGLIAEFGNAATFVVTITNDGTIYAKAFTLMSDRNAKENFTPLDPQSVLAKVISLPVTQWNYKDDAADKKHIGPVAQDFHDVFGLDGADDRHISMIDEGGVALAAIQGLNEKLKDKDVVIQRQGTEISELKARLDALEKMILSQK